MHTLEEAFGLLQNLPSDKRADIVQIIFRLLEERGLLATPPPARRPSGLAEGEFVVPDDFNDPLPPEILDEFERPL